MVQKFLHGITASSSGSFTFNEFNGPFQPELSERRVPFRHVTIMDLHSHTFKIQLMSCHTFVLITRFRTCVMSRPEEHDHHGPTQSHVQDPAYVMLHICFDYTVSHLCHVAARRAATAVGQGCGQQGIGVGANIRVGTWPNRFARNLQGCGVGSVVKQQVANSAVWVPRGAAK